ncbi:MAG: hypothetical protein CM15mV5_0410 [uncultured marine virus]|nr:MAG: hypothetical protein CM15mV5_0410 [uncultured marine virus]
MKGIKSIYISCSISFPYPPLTVNLDDQGNDTLGLYNENMWNKWVSFLQLGKSLYEYF